jgi:peptide/nickel transport system permease protein
MTSLTAYIVRRLLLLVLVVLGVTVLIFAITMLFPAEIRAYMYIRNVEQARPEAIPRVIQIYGLNDPFYVQYGRWLGNLLQGNLGWSYTSSQSVVEAISSRWVYTFQIVMFAAPIIIFVGIYLGVQSAIHRNGLIDHICRVLSIIGWSLPSFWLGLILISVFSGQLRWVSIGPLSQEGINHVANTALFTRYTGVSVFDGILNAITRADISQLGITLDALAHVVLPVIVIVTIDVALLIRVMRSSMLEALNKQYITTAKAKGLSKNVVIYKHARRNALIPVATLSGMLVAGLLGGLVITETVFAYGGLGAWAARAALSTDITAVLGYAILTAVIFVIANLIVDILYAYIDPRIRLD